MANREPTGKAASRPGNVQKARLAVVEDHAVVREGFVALINREADLGVCAEADGAAAALKAVEETHPDLIIVDLVLREGDGIELIKELRARFPKLPALVISMQDEELYAERTLRAGARGYVMKHCATEEVLDAIRAVLRGEIYVSRRMGARMLNKFVQGPLPSSDSALDQLTDRELQVFHLIGAGMSTRDIAPHLGISVKTVEAHRENLKHKLGLKDGVALIQSASLWVQHRKGPARPGAGPET